MHWHTRRNDTCAARSRAQVWNAFTTEKDKLYQPGLAELMSKQVTKNEEEEEDQEEEAKNGKRKKAKKGGEEGQDPPNKKAKKGGSGGDESLSKAELLKRIAKLSGVDPDKDENDEPEDSQSEE